MWSGVQDEFLTVEAEEKGIIDLSGIPTAEEQYASRHSFADKISIGRETLQDSMWEPS